MSSIVSEYRPTADFDWRSRHRSAYEAGIGDSRNICFTGGLPTPPVAKAMTGVTVGSGTAGYPPAYTYQPKTHQGQETTNTSSRSWNTQTRPNRSNSTGNSISIHTENNSTNAIASYLQIPESVNKSKGSLAEFAAEITCLFWFESAATLQYAEDLPPDGYVTHGLSPDAVPSIGFRKWVTTILSTTQVGKNVILLALMFIYRLKKFNPTVSGKRGSEFRLLTIALMLGNKFLDDNTYTNKTWAEVSGISVTEIHIMEVEFLSNMRYDLYASEAEWAEWKAKLGRFGTYYEKASKLALVDETRSNPPVTPTNQSFPHKLPSPPTTHHSGTYMPSNNYAGLPNPASTIPHLPRSPLRQRVPPGLLNDRKRSFDSSIEMPPAKRIHPSSGLPQSLGISTPASTISSTSTQFPPMNVSESVDPASINELARLPVPRIPITNSIQGNQLAPLIMPVNRAMSTVFPSTTTAWSQPVTPISAVPPNLYQNPIPSLGDGVRSQSAFPSAHTSPNGYNGTVSPLPGLSPSYFLTNRSSPYRPVRHVNTLLIPPPSAALQSSARNLSTDQMHYQPLSKLTTERRTGPVPFYQSEAWHQSNVSTPLAQHYPYGA